MKQFRCFNLGSTHYNLAQVRDKFPASLSAIRELDVGEERVDVGGDRWVRLPDLLQDDLPLTAEDATACRESAVRVRYKLRLERVATAALQGLCANSYDGHLNQPLSTASYAEMAEIAVAHAKALIAELDKQS